jgi:hypothetical protein
MSELGEIERDLEGLPAKIARALAAWAADLRKRLCESEINAGLLYPGALAALTLDGSAQKTTPRACIS